LLSVLTFILSLNFRSTLLRSTKPIVVFVATELHQMIGNTMERHNILGITKPLLYP